MTFLDVLKKAKESAASAFQEYLLTYRKFPNSIHAFFEGQDDSSFYMNFIMAYNTDKNRIFIHLCGKKDEVYRVHKNIESLKDSTGINLYFVDKDYSDILPTSYPVYVDLFVTSWYSIENYLVVEDVLIRVWNDLFHLINISFNVDKVVKKFHIALLAFHQYMLSITSAIIYLRRNGYSTNLDNLPLAEMLFFDDDLVLKIKSPRHPSEMVQIFGRLCSLGLGTLPKDDIDFIQDELSNSPPKIYIRGKYELWFFTKFIEALTGLMEQEARSAGGSVKIRTALGKSNAVQILGPRVQIPNELKAFLQSNLRL